MTSTTPRVVLAATMALAIAVAIAILILGGGGPEPDRTGREDPAEDGWDDSAEEDLVSDGPVSALDVGWSWQSTDWLSYERVGVLGRLQDGRHVAMQTLHYQFECQSCVVQLFDGVSWETHPPEPLIGRRVVGVWVGGGLLWAIVHGDASREVWVSSDPATWTRVEFDTTGFGEGDLPEPEAFVEPADVGHRFLAIDDTVLSVGAPGWIGWSDDGGRTLGFVEPPWAPREETQAWIADERFFILSGDELWSSGDGRDWRLLGAVTGFPEGAQGADEYSPEPHVVWLGGEDLMTMSWPSEGSQAIYRSSDAGLSWTEDPRPYPWDANFTVATVVGGWFQVFDPETRRLWVTADGRDWYTLDSPGLALTFETGGSGVAVRPFPRKEDFADSSQASSGRAEWQFAVPPD